MKYENGTDKGEIIAVIILCIIVFIIIPFVIPDCSSGSSKHFEQMDGTEDPFWAP
jgi:hypothetical protein|tara:strand:- start:4451 stop:4615 length:165 start_codon:yes stop_codon:yes gene_type:complete